MGGPTALASILTHVTASMQNDLLFGTSAVFRFDTMASKYGLIFGPTAYKFIGKQITVI